MVEQLECEGNDQAVATGEVLFDFVEGTGSFEFGW